MFNDITKMRTDLKGNHIYKYCENWNSRIVLFMVVLFYQLIHIEFLKGLADYC